MIGTVVRCGVLVFTDQRYSFASLVFQQDPDWRALGLVVISVFVQQHMEG